MSTKFYCINEVKNANITATSENAQFPISNLKHSFRSKIFRSLSNSDSLIFDFGYFSRIDSVMIVDDPMAGNKLLTCKVYLDNDPAFGSATEADVTIDPINGFSFLNFDPFVTARYMKIEMTSSAGYCEIGKIFAGAFIDVGECDYALPFKPSFINRANVSENEYGQQFVDERNTTKKIEGSLKTLTKSELAPFLDLFAYAGHTKPIWVQFDGILDNPNRISGYYYIASNIQEPTLDSSLHWNLPFNLKEAL